jgi:DNA invertase Pin-like site-specific DNA recombinase
MKVGYARISSGSDEQRQSLPVQQSILAREGCQPIISDILSGLNADRTGYQELRRLVASGQATEVVATEMSRLGRDALELDQFILLCDAAGVRVRTIADGVITMATADDLVMTRLKASMAKAESMRLSKRIRRGKDERRRQGLPGGRPPWGYQLSRDRSTLEPDPDQWPAARRFLDALAANEWRLSSTIRGYPEALPLASLRSVRAWLANPVLRGGLQWPRHQQVLWERHQPILSHDEFATYQAMTRARRHHWGASAERQVRLFTGLCSCSACGHRAKYYAGRRHACLRCGNQLCGVHFSSMREAAILEAVVLQMRTQAAHHLAQIASAGVTPQELELQRQIAALEQLADPDLAGALEAKRLRLQQLQAVPVVDAEMVEAIARADWWEGAIEQELTAILHQCLARVLVDFSGKQVIGVEFRF